MEPGKESKHRRYQRLPVRLTGSLHGRSVREVTVVDLSETGCLARCDALLDHGTILDLSLSLSDGPLEAKVRVTEASQDGSVASGEGPRYLAGLEFLGLPARDAERLRRLLDHERRKRSADAPSR